MTRVPFAGGSYCDAETSGEYAVLFSGRHVLTHLGHLLLPGQDVLFLRITTVGGFKVCGQGHKDGLAWVWEAGQWTSHGPTNGVSPCIFDNDGRLCVVRPAPDQTSQGYRYVDERGRVWLGDETYANTDLQIWEYTALAGVIIGQGETGAHVILPGSREHRLLEDGHTTFVRVHQKDGLFSVALVKPGEAVLFFAVRDELAQLPIVQGDVVVPPPPPPPPPPPEKKTMKMPDRVKQNVVALYERNVPLAEGSDEQRRELITKINQQNCFDLGRKWGSKRADNGRPVSKDSVACQEGDVLFSADVFNGATRKPQLPDEMEDISDQVFVSVEPVDHLGRDEPPPPDEPDPPADTKLEQRVRLLEDALSGLSEQQGEWVHIVTAQQRTIEKHDTKLKELEARLDEPFEVEGTTNRVFSHTHTLNVRVKRGSRS